MALNVPTKTGDKELANWIGSLTIKDTEKKALQEWLETADKWVTSLETDKQPQVRRAGILWGIPSGMSHWHGQQDGDSSPHPHSGHGQLHGEVNPRMGRMSSRQTYTYTTTGRPVTCEAFLHAIAPFLLHQDVFTCCVSRRRAARILLLEATVRFTHTHLLNGVPRKLEVHLSP